MKEKFAGIVDFAELGDFIEAPMRTYSSGMWARLGFAVATDGRPDILLVDEVLAVGDEAFQRKCTERIDKYRREGTTFIMVSHNMDLIGGLSQRVAWIQHGHLHMLGDPETVIQAYHRNFQR